MHLRPSSLPLTPAARGWHWPRFEQVLCGQMSDRERLGQPAHWSAARFDALLPGRMLALRALEPDAWLTLLQSPDAPLIDRLACGQWLALAGDPRIHTFAPDMVDIPGGKVRVGLPWSEVDAVMSQLDGLGLQRSWIEKECPRHEVVLAPFRLARYPVTNQEYRDFLVDTGHPEVPTSWHLRRYPVERSNHPVCTLSAAAADAYARWLRERTGRPFRLPTEAEWEWAAAGPQGRSFPWGDTFDADLANTAETGLWTTSTVGVFVGGESPFGVCDMAGNVEEYVFDTYQPYPGAPAIDDHLHQIHGDYRVARGGCYARFRDLARTRRRHGHNPRSAAYVMGFRLAESL
jgi:formylglycine-generating enzyme required for sulfatase activity